MVKVYFLFNPCFKKPLDFFLSSGTLQEGLYGISTNNLFYYYVIFGVVKEEEGPHHHGPSELNEINIILSITFDGKIVFLPFMFFKYK